MTLPPDRTDLASRRDIHAGPFRRFAGMAALVSVVAAPAALLQGCFPVVAAGVGTAAVVASDRRLPDVLLGDERIELTAGSRLNDRFKDQLHVNITSMAFTVLLTGEAVTAQIKADAEKAVAEIPQVKSVVNELQVAAPSSFGARSNDTYLTGRVKAAFVGANKFHINAVKVVTEAGVVYLLGLVTKQEGEAATEIARSISGVRKVVRIFDYVPVAPSPAQPAAQPAAAK